MKNRSVLILLALPVLLAGACSSEGDVSDRGDRNRGSIGKADHLGGSCLDACGGQSETGDCWCDDLCESYGDCCADKVDLCDEPTPTCDADAFCDAVCAGEEPEPLPPECPTPLCACDEFCGGFGGTPCDPGERCVDFPGDDCEPWASGADCIGICEPEPVDSCFNHCGEQSTDGSCWCDDYCTYYGDCCDDVAVYCEGRELASGSCVRNGMEPCETDADCNIGGCGGELCFNPAYGGGISTCDCAGPGAPVDGCGCVQGVCAWYE